MRYGWKCNIEELLDYAKQHNLTCWYRLPDYVLRHAVGKHDDDGDDTDSGKEDDDDDDESKDETDDDEVVEDGKEGKSPSWLDPDDQSFDLVITLRRAVVDIVQKNNVPCPGHLLDICANLTREPGLIISIYTNYELAIAPSDDDVEALRQAFGLLGKPLWYLGHDNYRWRWWNQCF